MNSRDWTIVVLVILGAVVLLPLLGMSLGGFGGMMGPGHMWGRGPWGMGPGMMGGYGGFGGIGLLTLVLLIVGVVLIARGLTAKAAPGEDPINILKGRLARGEITKEQFEELKRALQ